MVFVVLGWRGLTRLRLPPELLLRVLSMDLSVVLLLEEVVEARRMLSVIPPPASPLLLLERVRGLAGSCNSLPRWKRPRRSDHEAEVRGLVVLVGEEEVAGGWESMFWGSLGIDCPVVGT